MTEVTPRPDPLVDLEPLLSPAGAGKVDSLTSSDWDWMQTEALRQLSQARATDLHEDVVRHLARIVCNEIPFGLAVVQAE